MTTDVAFYTQTDEGAEGLQVYSVPSEQYRTEMTEAECDALVEPRWVPLPERYRPFHESGWKVQDTVTGVIDDGFERREDAEAHAGFWNYQTLPVELRYAAGLRLTA